MFGQGQEAQKKMVNLGVLHDGLATLDLRSVHSRLAVNKFVKSRFTSMSRAAIHLELVQIYQMFASLQPSGFSVLLCFYSSTLFPFFFYSFYTLYCILPAVPESAIYPPVITVHPELV